MANVKISHITKSFGDNVVLKEFDDSFQDGEFITLLGPSGCGKTTLLRMIAGFETPTTGEIWFDDQLVAGGRTFLPPEKRSIGMVFQSYAVWPHMNVYDNVAYPLQVHRRRLVPDFYSQLLRAFHDDAAVFQHDEDHRLPTV